MDVFVSDLVVILQVLLRWTPSELSWLRKSKAGLCLSLLNHCPECDALEAKLKRQQRVFTSLFFSSRLADTIFSSGPSDQASNATRLHNDVLKLMNAEVRDVKAKYEHPLSEAQVYVDRANALLAVQSVCSFGPCVT